MTVTAQFSFFFLSGRVEQVAYSFRMNERMNGEGCDATLPLRYPVARTSSAETKRNETKIKTEKD